MLANYWGVSCLPSDTTWQDPHGLSPPPAGAVSLGGYLAIPGQKGGDLTTGVPNAAFDFGEDDEGEGL